VRHARGHRIPVIVVTGFLGAGKTTLIKRFLQTPEGANTAVIVNEFGAVGIDDALVEASAEETVLLGNGCLCCTSRSDLELTLRRMTADRDRGVLPPFNRVIIETSGLADPSPILQTFVTDLALGGVFHVEGVITVADAMTGSATLDWSAEARKQIILADRLLVSKADLAGDAAADALTVQLRTLNRDAPLDRVIDGAVAPALFTEPVAAERDDAAARLYIAEAAHSDGIGSFVLTDEQPIAWDVFAQALQSLLALRGRDVLRVKGFLKVSGCQGPVLVQSVQHLAHPPVELQRWPGGRDRTEIVFITRHIPEVAIRALFDATRAVAQAAD
jgi:G3E family GTPase